MQRLFIRLKFILKKCAKLLWLEAVKIALVLFWTCFLIVPGLVCFVDYVFAEMISFRSAEMDVRGALGLSKELVRGQRVEILFRIFQAILIVFGFSLSAFFVLVALNAVLNISMQQYVFFVALATLLPFFAIAMPMIKHTICKAFEKATVKKIKRGVV